MKKIFSKILLTFFMIYGFTMAANIVAPTTGHVALAAAPAACAAPAGTSSTTSPINPTCNSDIGIINGKIYMFAYIIGGLVLGVSVFMIVYAGFKYATSQGDPKQTETAKMQIIAAGIGIFIVMLAFVILRVFTGAVGVAN